MMKYLKFKDHERKNIKQRITKNKRKKLAD